MPQPAQPDANPTPIPASSPGKVLLIDDGDAVRDVIRTFLEKRGFQVCGEAADGIDAIEKAKALKPDLIILDLAMPRMNGMEAASVLSRIMPKVPIILLTIYGDFMGSSLAAASGPEALKKAQELKPDFVLLDLRLPGMNGIETATALKAVLPQTKLVLFSAYADSLGNRNWASAIGVDLVVPKGSLIDMAASLKTLAKSA